MTDAKDYLTICLLPWVHFDDTYEVAGVRLLQYPEYLVSGVSGVTNMARPIRIEFKDASYHVMARGNERQKIFRSDEDRILFLKTCEQMVDRFGVVIHAYCLMSNHYHLVVSTPRANLSQGIGWLQTTYTICFNRKYGRSGHLYQGRFKAQVIEADEYVRVLIPYLHLNPVRPTDKTLKIDSEKFKEFERYPWSSHWEYKGKRKQPWVSLDWLSYWGSKTSHAQREYLRDMKAYFGEVAKSPIEGLKKGFLLGSEAFMDRLKEQIEKKNGQEEIKWKQRAAQGEIQRRAEKLVMSEPDERIQMWILSRLAGHPMVTTAKRYGYKDGSGVLQAIKRLESTADRGVKKKLEMLKRDMVL